LTSDWPPTVDIDRLMSELHSLAEISDAPEPPPTVTRIVFGAADQRARQMLAGSFANAGLSTRVDAMGNTFACWEGTDSSAPAVGTGSHIDAIPHAGMYDGTVGVLGGLEAIRALQRSGFRPKRSIELILFTSEEPTRFGIGCIGSRTMSGCLTPVELLELRGENGAGIEQLRQAAGFTGELREIALSAGYYDAFVELHIEQGPNLESMGLPIGVVTAIAAPATVEVTLTGEGGHAGAVLMPQRRDALAAAAEMIVAIESLAKKSRSQDLVATIGWLQVHPGAANSIANRVQFKIDIRDIDWANRDVVLESMQTAVDDIASMRSVAIDWRILNADPPASTDPRIVSAIERSADTLGLGWQSMISRAYHDSLFMARLAPTGMIFIPCRGGVSHRPDEYSSPEEIRAGVETLALTLAELAR
jgi:N-carbamoyl-L-amino-acid hydrolase